MPCITRSCIFARSSKAILRSASYTGAGSYRLEWITAGRSGGRLGASARVRVRLLCFGKTHQRLRKGLWRPFFVARQVHDRVI